VSVCLRCAWQTVPQHRTCSSKASVSIAAAGPSDDTCPWVGRAQLTTTFVGDQLTVSGQVRWSYTRQWQVDQSGTRTSASGPHSAVTAQITLASDAKTYFVLAGDAGVSLPPRLCAWPPGFRSSARVTPQRTATTTLFDYISAGRSTHCAFYHWRPHLDSDCCIGLEQSVWSSLSLQVFRSRLKTELFARSYNYD